MLNGRRLGYLGIVVWIATISPSFGQNSWVRQFGTSGDDFALGVAYDAAYVYTAGYQNDTDFAPPNPCRTGAESLNVEAFLRKYTSGGTPAVGFSNTPAATEIARATAVDGGGNVYVAGENILNGKAVLRKYASGGTLLWTTEFGAPLAPAIFFSVAVNASGVYVAGHITNDPILNPTDTDVIVRAYDLATGMTLLWSDEFGGSSLDSARGISADSTGVYVVGYTGLTFPSSGSAEAFIRKYDLSGVVDWADSFGAATGDDFAFSTAATGTSIYVAGYTPGLPAQTSLGLEDAFLRQYNLTGTPIWTREFGTSSADFAVGVAATSGAAYVIGYTGGQLPGQVSLGQTDAYVSKYDPTGNELWTTQFGTSGQDGAWSVSANGNDVYVSGCTSGVFSGQSSVGGSDAFLLKNPYLSVAIDIKPGSDENTINLGSNGIVQVAILSTTTFDATTVDPTSVSLAGASVKLKGNGTYQTSSQDLNGDGLLDLIVHVVTSALQLSDGDVAATLTGQTNAGQAIQGKDLVRIVP